MREARRERQRALFEPLDAEQLVAKRFLRRRRPVVRHSRRKNPLTVS